MGAFWKIVKNYAKSKKVWYICHEPKKVSIPFSKNKQSGFLILDQPPGKDKPMADEALNIKRIGKKLGLIILGMVLFLLITMWLKGMAFQFRIFMALFAGFSAWMGIISLVIWLWKETNQEEPSDRESTDLSR